MQNESLHVVENTAALTPGCSLWLIADPEASRWSAELDWYLNFQIMKAQRHKSPELRPEITRIANDSESPLPALSPLGFDAPLMLASGTHLPALRTVVIPYTGQLDAWFTACHKVWKNLRFPAARLFLPDGVEIGASRKWLSARWVNDVGPVPLQLVLGQNAAPQH